MNNNLLTVNETNLGVLRNLCEKYPASSVTAFFYLKMLKQLHPEEYESCKSLWLLNILDHIKFAQFSFENASETAPTDDIPKKDFLAVGVDTSAADQDRIVSQLIAEFSVATPKIQFDPEKHDGTINYSKPSLVEDPDIVSETLARFYLSQGYPGKAIKIYKKMCLLFPEKSCYFAAQISSIKNSKN